MASINSNISSLISPDILKTISSAAVIKTFGDQLVDQAKEKIISVATGRIQELKKLIEETIVKKIQAGIDHNTELKRLEVIYKNKQITEEQYNAAVAAENTSYQAKIKDLETQQAKFKEDLSKILSDPYKKLKAEFQIRKAKLKRQKVKNKAERAKARRDKLRKLAINAAKTLAPIIAAQIASQLTGILSQRGKLEKLVNQVNAYIVQANTPETIAIATNLRNNTITLINNSINKLQRLQKTLQQITIYITIFTLIVNVLSAIPIPAAVPPGIGVPINLIVRIVKTIEKANKLVISLNVVLAIATVALEGEVGKLYDLIERLREVNQLLDANTLNNLNQQELTDLTSGIYNNNDQYPEYKGFKFKIKTEENKAFEVKGNKRRFAVAVDRDGVEVLKSELSYTLDPQDLVDQLKLIIDQRNLQG